jgi:hypothetical protein
VRTPGSVRERGEAFDPRAGSQSGDGGGDRRRDAGLFIGTAGPKIFVALGALLIAVVTGIVPPDKALRVSPARDRGHRRRAGGEQGARPLRNHRPRVRRLLKGVGSLMSAFVKNVGTLD